MSNSKSLTQNPNIPTYLPVADTAPKYGLSETVLTQLILAGNIEAVQLPTGELLVAADANGHKTPTKEETILKEFAHLRGQWITVSEASTKYPYTRDNDKRMDNLEYVQTQVDSYPMKLNEAEIAYCAKIHSERKASGSRSGVPLLNKDGRPYELKHPALSEYRRRRRRRQQG